MISDQSLLLSTIVLNDIRVFSHMLVYNVVLQDGRLPVVSRYFTVKETEVQRVYNA